MKCDAPSVFEKARVPENPSSPSVKKNTMLGGLAFAVLYCAYLIVKFLMDDTFKTPEDINKMFGSANCYYSRRKDSRVKIK